MTNAPIAPPPIETLLARAKAEPVRRPPIMEYMGIIHLLHTEKRMPITDVAVWLEDHGVSGYKYNTIHTAYSKWRKAISQEAEAPTETEGE